MEASLKEKTARGLFWGGFSNGIQQLLNLFFGIFLARILNADDYGTVGMLAIFSAIATTIQDSGFTAALTNKKEIKHEDYNAVFWFSTLAGITMYAVLFFCAPLIADFFNNQRLIPLSRFLFLGFLIASTGIAHNALLFKNLQVKEISKISIISLVVSGSIGLTMAFNGMGYWGIASQNVSYITCVTLLRWHYSSWRPTFRLWFHPLRGMYRFSFKLFLTNIINQVNGNIFSAILGRFYTPLDVGYYTQGNKWMSMGQQTIGGMINNIAQPVFVQIGEDNERRIRALKKMLAFTSFISFPALLGLAFVSKELIVIAVGEKWLPSVPILQLLCFFGAIWPIINLYFQVAISQGRSDIYFWTNLIFGALQVGIAFFMFRFGILWMVLANVLGYVLLLIAWQIIINRLVHFPYRAALKGILPYMGCTCLILGATYYLTLSITNYYFLIIAKIIIVAVSYFVVMKLGKSVILNECMTFAREKLKKRS